MKFTAFTLLTTATATTTIVTNNHHMNSIKLSGFTLQGSTHTPKHESMLLPAQLKAKKLHEKNLFANLLEKTTTSNLPLSSLRQQHALQMKTEKLVSYNDYEQMNLSSSSSTSSTHHLRSVKSIPNNFFTIAFDGDADCSSPEYTYGYLVNYCYVNNDGTSYLYKVNKKQNTLIELTYTNSKCNGVPDKILNENLEGSTYWGECIDGSKYIYYDSFPHPTEPLLGIIQTLEEYCTDGEYLDINKVIGYNLDRATNCRQNTMNIWQNVDLTGCSYTNTFIVNYFINNKCTGPIAYQETWTVPTTCYETAPTNDYVHPDHWVFQYYCGDPSGSTTPPPPATTTCNYPDLYMYIGNGLCEPEYNTEGCGYDGGDCCVESCNEFSPDCPTDNTNCIDPQYTL